MEPRNLYRRGQQERRSGCAAPAAGGHAPDGSRPGGGMARAQDTTGGGARGLASQEERGHVGAPSVSVPHARRGGPAPPGPGVAGERSPRPRARGGPHERRAAGAVAGRERAAQRPAMGRGASARRSVPVQGGTHAPRAPREGRQRRASRGAGGTAGSDAGLPHRLHATPAHGAHPAPRSPALGGHHGGPWLAPACLLAASRLPRTPRAPGGDPVTATPEAEQVDANRRALQGRRRAPRAVAPPVERGGREQADGTQRPRGPPGCEAQRGQRVVVRLLEARGAPAGPAVSQGFRPGHRPQHALHERREPGRTLPSPWRVEADGSGGFDPVDGRPRREWIQQRGRDHRGAHILMSQEFLHRPDIVALLAQLRGETVPLWALVDTNINSCCTHSANIGIVAYHIFEIRNNFYPFWRWPQDPGRLPRGGPSVGYGTRWT